MFYDHCFQARSTTKSAWTKKPQGMKVFSWWLNNLSRKYPIVFNDIVQSVYDRHMDIMYLYEIFIAQKNHCTLEQATQIATLKRHSRHNYNNLNQVDFQQENYNLPVDY
jgi:hypothetical protein